jgi:beta-glucosidase-like glycosyl hydrolase
MRDTSRMPRAYGAVMHSKAVIHAWLGAALQHLAPDAEVWGGGRRTDELLIKRHRIMTRRIALFECVGSTPMVRDARSSRINKKQVAAYIEEPQWVPWHGRIFFVLGHPAPAASALPVRDASHFLRFIRLNDAAAHGAVSRTIGSQIAVLLKNEGGLLPLDPDAGSIVIIGQSDFVDDACLGGGGSSKVTPLYTVTPVAGMQEVLRDHGSSARVTR